MSYFFGDSFDLYAAGGDMAGYWDGAGFTGASGGSQGGYPGFVAGRFGGQAIQLGYNTGPYKSSGANDAVHHITFAVLIQHPIQPSGTANYGACFQFNDVNNAQCTVQFRVDGA